MALETRLFDPSEHLDSSEAIAAYLDAALEDGDAAFIADAIGVVSRAIGMTQIARDTGLAREALYRALSENGNPEFATVMRVLKALGVRLRAEPAQAGAIVLP
jgi:probable addiction module antidote protein